MTELLYAATSPVFTVDGESVGQLARDCLRLEVCEGIEGLRHLQLYLAAVGPGASSPAEGFLYLDGRTIALGSSVRVSLGPYGDQRDVFEGVVSAVEAVFVDGEPPLMMVLAEDELMRLRMTRRMRSYRDVTDAGIAEEVARLHGLQADASADGPRYDVVQQANQSDLAFLRERARLIRAEIWCTDRTLHFRSRPNRSGTSVTLLQGADLLDIRIRADLAHQRSSVTVTGYDAKQAQVIDEEAGADVVAAEATGGRTGPRLVADLLGAAASFRVREAALTSKEASDWAAAEMLRRGRMFVTACGVTSGTPELVVGSRVTLQDVGDLFDGDGYYVTMVRHSFDNRRGFRTAFEAERATINEVT